MWNKRIPIVVLTALAVAAALSAGDAEVVVQTGHAGQVNSFAVSPDSRLVASAGSDGTIVVWSASTGRQLRTLKGHASQAMSVAWGGDGSRIASGGTDGTVRVWIAADGREERRFRVSAPIVDSVAMSRNGGILAAGGNDGAIRLWDLGSGRELGTLAGHAGNVAALAFDPTGAFLASGSYDHEVRIWDVGTGRTLRLLEGHPAAVMGTAWSRDGRWIASSGGGYAGAATVIVWDAETGKARHRFTVNDEWVSSVVFGPDGRYLIGGTNTRGRALRVFDLAKGADAGTLRTNTDAVFCVGFSPDAKFFAYGGARDAVTIVDAKTWREIRTLEGLVRGTSSTAVGPNGDILASASEDSIRIWDLRRAKETRRIAAGSYVAAVAFSPRGDLLAAACRDATVGLWNLADGRKVRTFSGHRAAVRCVAFDPSGSVLASGSDDSTVRLWNVASGELVRTLAGHADFVHAVAFGPDGSFLASGSGDTTIKVWDPGTGGELGTLAGHENWVEALAAGPDGRSLVSGSGDETVKLWDVEKRIETRTFAGHTDRIASVALAADGKSALSGSEDGRLIVWDLASGRETLRMEGAAGGIVSAAFEPDGRALVSGNKDGSVKIRNRKTGAEIASLIGFRDGEWIIITPKGYFEASPGGAKHLNARIGDEAYAIDQFYAKFYRPELVRAALAGGAVPEGETLKTVLAERSAPEVEILSPRNGETTEASSAALDLRIRDTGGGVGDVLVYLNGSQVANETRGLSVRPERPDPVRLRTLTLPLVAGENSIKVVVLNRDGSMESNPAVVVVTSKAVLSKPNLYALAVGIDTYRNESISLAYAVRDAEAFAEALKYSSAPLFERIEVEVLTTPEKTTKEAVVKALERMKAKVKPNDFFVFYDASHGIVEEEGDSQYFLLTSNVLLLSSRRIAADALSQKELASLLGGIPAEKKLVVLDTCNAGKGGKEIAAALMKTRGLTEATAIKLLKRAIGSAVFAASSDTQQALEGYKGHGLFTYVLIEGLRGKADTRNDGFITVLGLAEYAEEEVVRLSEEVFKRQQTPTIQTSANFPIGKVR